MATRIQNGIQGAQAGAQVGSQFGGYGAAAGAAIGAVLGLMTPDYEKKAIEKYNEEVVMNTAMDFMDLRRAQNVANIEYSQALASYQDNKATTTATYNASFGAADIIGASAEAMQQVLDYQTTQAMAQTTANWEMGVENMNIQQRRLVNSASNALRRKRGDQNKMDFAGMIQTGMQLYGQYKGTGQTTTASSTGGGLSGMSDFGSFGKSGSATGTSGIGSLFG